MEEKKNGRIHGRKKVEKSGAPSGGYWLPVAGLAALVAGVTAYKVIDASAAESLPTFVIESAATHSVATDQKPAPDFSLVDADGKTIRLSDYRGKIVVLNFWATWCPPCRKEIPDFLALQAEYGSDVQFIGIALDEEGWAKVKPYVKANNITYPVVLGDKPTIDSFGEMNAIPVTYIIDRQGNINQRYVGMRPKATLEDWLKPLIASSRMGIHKNDMEK